MLRFSEVGGTPVLPLPVPTQSPYPSTHPVPIPRYTLRDGTMLLLPGTVHMTVSGTLKENLGVGNTAVFQGPRLVNTVI